MKYQKYFMVLKDLVKKEDISLKKGIVYVKENKTNI